MSDEPRRRPGIPRDGRRSDRHDAPYRSLEGALGQAYRTSRRAGGSLVRVVRDGDGWRLCLASEPVPAGAIPEAEIRAVWADG